MSNERANRKEVFVVDDPVSGGTNTQATQISKLWKSVIDPVL